MSWRQSTSPLRDEVATSRAMNLDATPDEIRAICAKHKLAISVIEPLLSGGTRVVTTNGDGAATLRKAMKAKLIPGAVKRTAWATTAY